jgi:hypothetical protein
MWYLHRDGISIEAIFPSNSLKESPNGALIPSQ